MSQRKTTATSKFGTPGRVAHDSSAFYAGKLYDGQPRGGDVPYAENPITRDEFLEYNKSVWNIAAEPARKIGHLAPFPVELPRRLIQFYTFENEVVLDPFMGSGQSAIAARKSNRHYIGYEIEQSFMELARQRIEKESQL